MPFCATILRKNFFKRLVSVETALDKTEEIKDFNTRK